MSRDKRDEELKKIKKDRCLQKLPLLPVDDSVEQNFDKSPNDTRKNRLRHYLVLIYKRRGLLWITVLVVFQSVEFITLKRFGDKTGIWPSIFFRNVSLAFLSVGILWDKSKNYCCLEMFLFITGGILDVLGNGLIAFAVRFLWIGDVSCISLNLPIPTSLLASMFLGEKLDVADIVCLLVNGVGLVFVCKPSFLFHSVSVSSSPKVGLLLSFMSLIASTLLTFISRFLVKREADDAYLMTCLSGMAGIVISGCAASVVSSWEFPKTFNEWCLGIVLAVSSILTVYPQFKVLETETVSTATVLGTITSVLTCVYDVVVTNRPIEWQAIIGIIFVISSSISLHVKNEGLNEN